MTYLLLIENYIKTVRLKILLPRNQSLFYRNEKLVKKGDQNQGNKAQQRLKESGQNVKISIEAHMWIENGGWNQKGGKKTFPDVLRSFFWKTSRR